MLAEPANGEEREREEEARARRLKQRASRRGGLVMCPLRATARRGLTNSIASHLSVASPRCCSSRDARAGERRRPLADIGLRRCRPTERARLRQEQPISAGSEGPTVSDDVASSDTGSLGPGRKEGESRGAQHRLSLKASAIMKFNEHAVCPSIWVYCMMKNRYRYPACRRLTGTHLKTALVEMRLRRKASTSASVLVRGHGRHRS